MATPLVAWLGDDFTGAAAVMEVLSFAGLPSVLFLSPPTRDRLKQFPDMRGIGIATMARTWSPDRMRAELPPLYDLLDRTGAELVHYKTCSTLDSAPHIGSIGRAMELGVARFGPAPIPVIVAAPAIRRWQAFGNLFAGYGDDIFRLDRHPVMSRHPVTPMSEADVARHLSAQTDMPMRCLDVEALRDPDRMSLAPDGTDAYGVAIDLMTLADERRVGALVWGNRARNRFVVGSQGVEYALVAHWRATGEIDGADAARGLGPTDRMAVVSGSVSPVTAEQIGWARDNGFAVIPLDATYPSETACAQAEDAAALALNHGATPVIATAEGPDSAATITPEQNDRVGAALGAILRRLIDRCDLQRVVVSGGDTSGHVCTALGLHAVTALAPTIPGAAILRGHAAGPMDGIEIALKGGQMGSGDYFGWVRDGGGAR